MLASIFVPFIVLHLVKNRVDNIVLFVANSMKMKGKNSVLRFHQSPAGLYSFNDSLTGQKPSLVGKEDVKLGNMASRHIIQSCMH